MKKLVEGALGPLGVLVTFALAISLIQSQRAGADVALEPEDFYLTADMCPNLLLSRSVFTYGDADESGPPGQIAQGAIRSLEVVDRRPGASLRSLLATPRNQVFSIVDQGNVTLGVIHLSKATRGWRLVQLQECS